LRPPRLAQVAQNHARHHSVHCPHDRFQLETGMRNPR
jgi:hypothetical protein